MDKQPSYEEQLAEEFRAKQRNILWPDTQRNGAIVDEFLLKGDTKAKPFQRWGARIIGGCFLITGTGLMASLVGETDLSMLSTCGIAFGFCLFGGLTFARSFRR